MNEAHFHLIINHFPIILPLVGFFLLVIGLFLKNDIVKRISLGVFIIAAIATIFTMNSGKGAEEIVEELGRSHKAIHVHEKYAETFAIMVYVLGFFSVLVFWFNWKKHPLRDLGLFLVLGISMIVVYLATGTGRTGGEITHVEIRSNQPIEKD